MGRATARRRNTALATALLLGALAAPAVRADNRPAPEPSLPPVPAPPTQQPTNKSLVPHAPRVEPLESHERTFRVPGTVLWQARPESPARIDREALRRRVLGFFSSDPDERARSAVAISLPGHAPGHAPIPRREKVEASSPLAAADEAAPAPAPPAAAQRLASARRHAPPLPPGLVQLAIVTGSFLLALGWLVLSLRLLRRGADS